MSKLAQLALMLRGNGMMGPGYGGSWSGPRDFNSWGASQPMGPAANSWAAMPNSRTPGSGSHLHIMPAQEFLLGPMNPAWDIPYGSIPDWAGPKPEYIPIPGAVPFPGTGPLPPPLPFPPFNPPLEIPYEYPDDSISEYGDGPRKMTKECKRQWAEAADICQQKRMKYYAQGNFDEPFDLHGCMMGLVSEACGGTPVDWGPKGKPYKPPLRA